MTARERFLEVMKFNTKVPTLKWEFGYWGETINRFYREGLPKRNYQEIPKVTTCISSGIYSTSWTSENKYLKEDEYPHGFVLSAGGIYYPNQGFAEDIEIRDYFGMDVIQHIVPVNLFFYPIFDTIIYEENDDKMVYLDIDGVKRIYLKETATMASAYDWPIKDWESWLKLKEERLSLDNLRDRFPANWNELVKEYKDRDYVLAFGGYPMGFFGSLAHFIGYERLFYMFFDEPELIHDILDTFTNLWIALLEEVLKDVEIDLIQIWEDISFDKGCMISEAFMREFLLPYYKRFTSFCHNKGIDNIFVDTDGNCMNIIPFFIEAGVNGMYPFEVDCKMDILEVRRRFPELKIMGGIPKSRIKDGKKVIDEILKPVEELLKKGAYIPFGDHFIPPDVDFENFCYYRNRLNEIIDNAAK